MTTDGLRHELQWAIEAAQSKKAAAMTLLDLTNLSAFTGSFLLCSGLSTRQVEAISDAIAEAGARRGIRLAHREGKSGAEWVLLDFGHVIAHVFTERARKFYDLERLWRAARRTDIPDVEDMTPRVSRAQAAEHEDSL
ncbi:MAG: ribosome silencing factor [Candidatus Acidiferrales bacterium]